MSTDRQTDRQRRHYWWIDLLRFLAAFVVMAGHARGSFLAEYSVLPQDQHTPIVFGFYFLTRLGFEAVMIFFVLSGFLVGGKAVERITEGTFRAKQYAIDRFARIMYNPQNETEDGNKSKWSKIKTKRDSPQNEAYLRVRFFNRPPYPIFAPKSTRLRRGQG